MTEALPKIVRPDERRPTLNRTAVSILGHAALAAVILTCVLAGIASLERYIAVWPFHHSIDRVSQVDRQMRSDAFAAMAPLQLSMVPDRDLLSTSDAMQLPPPQKLALQNALVQIAPATSPGLTANSAPSRYVRQASGAVLATANSNHRLRLAWLTLWDTDVEDKDVVRIDSQGYSRTVTLTKEPLTFAIPVPADGVVKVTGIRDGDGGGITVGLASGASKAVFPVMSIGQVLGLRVRVD